MKKSLIILMAIAAGGLIILSTRGNSSSSSPTKNSANSGNALTNNIYSQAGFNGNKGEKSYLQNGRIELDAELFSDNNARFYNIGMPDGKIIYFFVVKDKNGIYRAAANACQVCFSSHKGFHQEGNEIVCNNCGNRYPIEKIATEKGGCNPGPINPDLPVKNGKITISQSEIEQVAGLF